MPPCSHHRLHTSTKSPYGWCLDCHADGIRIHQSKFCPECGRAVRQRTFWHVNVPTYSCRCGWHSTSPPAFGDPTRRMM